MSAAQKHKYTPQQALILGVIRIIASTPPDELLEALNGEITIKEETDTPQFKWAMRDPNTPEARLVTWINELTIADHYMGTDPKTGQQVIHKPSKTACEIYGKLVPFLQSNIEGDLGEQQRNTMAYFALNQDAFEDFLEVPRVKALGKFKVDAMSMPQPAVQGMLIFYALMGGKLREFLKAAEGTIHLSQKIIRDVDDSNKNAVDEYQKVEAVPTNSLVVHLLKRGVYKLTHEFSPLFTGKVQLDSEIGKKSLHYALIEDKGTQLMGFLKDAEGQFDPNTVLIRNPAIQVAADQDLVGAFLRGLIENHHLEPQKTAPDDRGVSHTKKTVDLGLRIAGGKILAEKFNLDDDMDVINYLIKTQQLYARCDNDSIHTLLTLLTERFSGLVCKLDFIKEDGTALAVINRGEDGVTFGAKVEDIEDKIQQFIDKGCGPFNFFHLQPTPEAEAVTYEILVDSGVNPDFARAFLLGDQEFYSHNAA